ncbi:MAG: dicarboxylate/amino acid:cation symporter [Bdellovibrionales bacterium]|nr:dicarboxylate/amino acid:cation symporter [Bdellovibrionales bacterium]
MSNQGGKKGFISAWGIFLGLVVGTLIGAVFNHLIINYPSLAPKISWINDNICWPMGNAFLQALFMIVVPLVFSSLLVGVANLGGGKGIGRLGGRLFLFYACTTILATGTGQLLVNTLKPGKSLDQATMLKAAEENKNKLSSLKAQSSMVEGSIWPGIVTKIIPRNIIDQFGKTNMLSVIFVSLIFGLALLYLPKNSSKTTFIQFMSALSDASVLIIGWIMKIAPFAVAGLMIAIISTLGVGLIQKMFFYIGVLMAGMLIHFCVYTLILKFVVRFPIKRFFKEMVPVFYTAFGTSSSSATMPVTMNTLETRLGAPRSIVNFSVPLGTVVNMDGTALFEVVATIFLAQFFGVEMTLGSHFFLLAIVFITSIGVASVPGGSLPILMSAIVVLGIPPEGMGVIIGVDRLMDMCRTVVNVTGDSVAALFLSKTQKTHASEKSHTVSD